MFGIPEYNLFFLLLANRVAVAAWRRMDTHGKLRIFLFLLLFVPKCQSRECNKSLLLLLPFPRHISTCLVSLG